MDDRGCRRAARGEALARVQTLLRDAIPTVALPGDAGTLRVIAGALDGTPGAAETVTPVVLWDVRFRKGADARLPFADGFTAAVYVRSGSARVAGTHPARARQLALLTRSGADTSVHAEEDSELLVVGGRPIEEPVVAYGPFVMNTEQEIETAIEDFRAGRFGQLD